MKKLFLLDGMALIYRAYFAMNKSPRITSTGLNTSAIFGFCNTLLEVLKKQNPTHIAVVFDTAAPTNRHEEFESYKANRQAIPEDLEAAIPYVVQLIEGFNIPVLTLDGYEADDIIGTLAKKAEQHDFQVYCMTPDKDFAQLVSPNIFIYKPARLGDGAEILGVDEILQKWEVQDVTQVIDILGLWGDAVDNIPGIPGIGEKTAKKLIQQYHSIENLIANSSELKGKQKENVENFAEQGLLSKKLATIQLDVPIEFNEDFFEVKEYNKEALEKLFVELEFRNLGKRVFGDSFASVMPSSSGQMDLFGGTAEPMQNSLKSENSASSYDDAGINEHYQNIHNTPHDYKILQDEASILAYVEVLKQQKAFAFDTETDGMDPHLSNLVGFSFSFKAHEAVYIPVENDFEKAKKTIGYFKEVFENPEIMKVGQNIKFDLLVLFQYYIQVQGPLFDTMLAHYLLDPDSRHNMDVLSENYLSYKPVPITDLIGNKGVKQGNMRDVSLELISEYAAEDADVTWRLKEVFEKELEANNLLDLAHDVEFPLVYVLAEMESAGVKIDTQKLQNISVILETEIGKLEKSIYEKAGVRFNIASPKQLGEVLFDKLQLDPKAKRTKTGQYKTGEEILSALAHKSDIVKDILEFRQLQKLKSTYVDALPSLISPKTGFVHTSYNQAVASTGRLSSTNPNLQNIPVKTTRGREIRTAFVPRNPDHIIVSADYSQIELRLLAEMSKDPGLVEAFNLNLDIHKATASKVYKVELDEVSSDQRRNAKAVNFGIIYGQTAFGLSQSLGISRKEAAEIIEAYFTQYPGIKEYMNQAIASAKEKGYVETLLKRKRFLRDILSANATVRAFAERNAINAPIQGSAADMIKIAMINIQKEIKDRNLKGKMVMQVHDELVFDIPKNELEEFKGLIQKEMQEAIKLSVPIIVEVGVGDNWLEAH